MKVKANNLTGKLLDWAVAKCEGSIELETPDYSIDWAQGGPIIDREHITLKSPTAELTMFWAADIGTERKFTQWSHYALEAAMRCYVMFKLGAELDVPDIEVKL